MDSERTGEKLNAKLRICKSHLKVKFALLSRLFQVCNKVHLIEPFVKLEQWQEMRAPQLTCNKACNDMYKDDTKNQYILEADLTLHYLKKELILISATVIENSNQMIKTFANSPCRSKAGYCSKNFDFYWASQGTFSVVARHVKVYFKLICAISCIF